MAGHLLGVLQPAVVFQVNGDAGCSPDVTSDRGEKTPEGKLCRQIGVSRSTLYRNTAGPGSPKMLMMYTQSESASCMPSHRKLGMHPSRLGNTPQHWVLFGMTGAGKSVIIADLLAQIGHEFRFRLIVEGGLSHAVLTETQGCHNGLMDFSRARSSPRRARTLRLDLVAWSEGKSLGEKLLIVASREGDDQTNDNLLRTSLLPLNLGTGHDELNISL
jgi:hypothetical protein